MIVSFLYLYKFWIWAFMETALWFSQYACIFLIHVWYKCLKIDIHVPIHRDLTYSSWNHLMGHYQELNVLTWGQSLNDDLIWEILETWRNQPAQVSLWGTNYFWIFLWFETVSRNDNHSIHFILIIA